MAMDKVATKEIKEDIRKEKEDKRLNKAANVGLQWIQQFKKKLKNELEHNLLQPDLQQLWRKMGNKFH